MRDHLRYTDEVQCTAARVIQALRKISRENGDPKGTFDTFHIRRGDMTGFLADKMSYMGIDFNMSAEKIYQNTQDLLQDNETLFIATDERNKEFFRPLRKHYHIYFLDDFIHLFNGLSPAYYGMLDQLIASRGRIFIGSYWSTFTGYINRLRGYRSQKDKAEGYQQGVIKSYHYYDDRLKFVYQEYKSMYTPMWSREFPVGTHQACMMFRGFCMSNLVRWLGF